MKKNRGPLFPSEGTLKEQIHYFTCVLEDIRSQNGAVIERMEVGFAMVYEKMAEMEERLTLKVDTNIFAIKKIFEKEKEQDREIALLKLKSASA